MKPFGLLPRPIAPKPVRMEVACVSGCPLKMFGGDRHAEEDRREERAADRAHATDDDHQQDGESVEELERVRGRRLQAQRRRCPPPKPAMAADKVKTASVVMRGFMPSVSQAAGLSFSASSR